MPIKNTQQQYGWLAQLFHWAIVVLIVTQYILAEQFEALPRGLEKYHLINDHKSFGMAVLILATLRLAWRFMSPPPKLPATMKGYEVTLSHISHWLIYGLIFAIPISGWLMSSAADYPIPFFDWFKFPALIGPDKTRVERYEEIHELLNYLLFSVVVIHTLAALKHHFVDKDNVLRRMVPFWKLK